MTVSSKPAAQFLQDYKDRRSSLRIEEKIKASLQWTTTNSEALLETSALILNTNEYGFGIETHKEIPVTSKVQIQFKNSDTASAVSFQCKVKWARAILVGTEKTFRYGLQISERNPKADKTLYDYLYHAWHQQKAWPDRRVKSWIKSLPVSFLNRHQKNISGLLDSSNLPNQPESTHVVILSPDFGQTKTSMLALSYYLCMNGFKVFRYDHSDHVGESTGNIAQTKLQTLYSDLEDSIEFLHDNLTVSSLSIITTGLMARPALRLISNTKEPVHFFAGILPVFHLSHAFERIYQENLFESFKNGQYHETVDVLGFPVQGTTFISDALENHFDSWKATASELNKIQQPLLFLTSQETLLNNPEETEEALSCATSSFKESLFIPKLSLPLQENTLSILDETIKALIQKMKLVLFPEQKETAFQKILTPDLREICLQIQRETDQIRSYNLSHPKEEPTVFWERYLERFHFAIRLPEYRSYYERITSLLGPIQAGDFILDAGCGNGSFGTWLLYKQKEKEPRPLNPFVYIGADFVEEALKLAQKTHEELIKNLNFADSFRPLFKYKLMDLNQTLPYPTGYFDKISCNLVLTYLNNPRASLRELYRIIKPGGRIVLTTVRPNPDFSILYRGFLEICQTPEEREACRRLLNNTSHLLEKEKEGVFRFFTNKELFQFMDGLNIASYTLEKTLAGQLNILMIQKPA